jgi:membrane protein
VIAGAASNGATRIRASFVLKMTLAALHYRLAALWGFAIYAVRRFVDDGCLTGAGALSYTTIVALVPLTAIAFAVLSAFPVFADTRDQLLIAIFRTFVPQVGTEVEGWFRYFAGNAARATTIGVLALAVTVIMLLATVEDQLHRIWRVTSPRPWVQRILAYWAILTLGPMLLGVSFSLPTYVDLAVRHTGLDATELSQSHGVHDLLQLLPFLLEAAAFTLLYALIPNCSVRWREALAGALVAALLVELLKVGFAFYISYFSSYRAVYGAVAAIPIFLLWMYVVWSAVLFGAVVAAALPQWRIDRQAEVAPPGAHRLGLALALLAELGAQARQGGTLSVAALADRLGVATAPVDDDLSLLRNAGFVAEATGGGWVLSRALDGATLVDLYRALDLPLALSLTEEPAFRWQARIAPALARVASRECDALGVPLSEIVGAGAPVAPLPHSRRHRRA